MTAQRVTSGRGRVPELDGVRGIAILLVMLYHFKIYGTGWNSPPGLRWYDLCNFGWTGVNVFFVLSGLLITGILFDARENRSYYRVFYARRTLRIFPLYYAALAIVFFALPPVLKETGLQAIAQDLHRTYQLPSWLYFQNWTVALTRGAFVSTLISHFWSLCVEEQFYVVWPLCIRKLRQRRPMMIFAAVLVCAAPFLRWMAHRTGFAGAAYILTICQMDSLALGALLAVGMRAEPDWTVIRKLAPAVAAAAAAGLIAVIAVSQRVRYGGMLMDTAGFSLVDLLVAAALVLLMAGRESAWHVRLVRSRLLRFFGKYSYGLYVVHQPAIYLLASCGLAGSALAMRLHQNAATVIALTNAIGLGVSLVLALLSWHLIEKRFLRLKDRIGPEPMPIRTVETAAKNSAGLPAA